MGMETTLARYGAQAADKAWKRHRTRCPRCAKPSGKYADPMNRCTEGRRLFEDMTSTGAALRRERDLDRQARISPPNMDPLF